jgi:uncharacterized protein
MSTSLQPLPQSRRDLTLDVLRGFALAGVLLTFCITDVRSAPGYAKTFLDDLVDWPKWIFIENRMYTLLIIIFGIGFHVQLEKAKTKGVSFVPVFLRRSMGLIVIGFLHAIFLSTRDILMFYGIAGAALLLLRRLKNWQLFALMAFLFLVVTPIIARFQQAGFKAFSLAQANNYADHVQHNWQFFKLYHQIYFIYIEMLFHFMLGYMLGRSGIFQKIKDNYSLRRKLMVVTLIGSAVLIPLCYYVFPDTLYPLVEKIKAPWILYVAAIGLRLTWQIWMIVSVTLYATILLAICKSIKGKRWLAPLAAFGQMSLSNYLIQSIVLVPYLLVFDKYDNMPPFSGFILFLIVLAVQLVFSKWWMARHTMGPFEWLLRSFTYWKWQPIKKSFEKKFDDDKPLVTVSAPAYQ